MKVSGSEAESNEELRESELREELAGSSVEEVNDDGTPLVSDSDEQRYVLCDVVDFSNNGEEALLKCDCAAYFSFGGLPCRHILAVLEHEFNSAAVLLTVPRRWWVRTAMRIADKIHASLSSKESSPSGEGEPVAVGNSRRALIVRV